MIGDTGENLTDSEYSEKDVLSETDTIQIFNEPRQTLIF